MAKSITAQIVMNADTSAIAAKIFGMSDKRMQQFAADITATAKSNAAGLPFQNSKGDLEEKIEYRRIAVSNYEIRTYSGHASYIEFGTRFIEGKMPFLWPAYRSEKKRFLSSGPWI